MPGAEPISCPASSLLWDIFFLRDTFYGMLSSHSPINALSLSDPPVFSETIPAV